MNSKVTKVLLNYPLGEEPNLCLPERYNKYNRFLIGRLGPNPLVAIGMNPSVADESYSDRTINRIIQASKKLGHDGWIVANVYPERATNSADLDKFDSELSKRNISIIIDFLIKNNIDEVWGAWGNLGQTPLVEGKKQLTAAFKENHISVYSFAPLTKGGQPVHPLNRRVKQKFTVDNKLYLDF